jgi:hypothetical protein
MNKYEFFHNELAEMVSDNDERKLIEHYTWMSECAKFLDAVDYMTVIDKDAIDEESTVVHLFLDCDEFDARLAVIIAEHGIEALHRKHRKSRRKAKVRRKSPFIAGVGKGFKGNSNRSVRHEYDIPIGKSNYIHKVNSHAWHY